MKNQEIPQEVIEALIDLMKVTLNDDSLNIKTRKLAIEESIKASELFIQTIDSNTLPKILKEKYLMINHIGNILAKNIDNIYSNEFWQFSIAISNFNIQNKSKNKLQDKNMYKCVYYEFEVEYIKSNEKSKLLFWMGLYKKNNYTTTDYINRFDILPKNDCLS